LPEASPSRLRSAATGVRSVIGSPFCVVVDDRRDPDTVDVVALVEGLALDVVGVGVRWRPNNMTST